MKKTLSITLGGRIFAIEEDGYNVLDSYLKSLRTHFATDPSVDELVQDIEYSFGEKFSEKLVKGKQVVTLEDVEAVIAVVGRVEEIADENTDSHNSPTQTAQAATEPQTTPRKRLYRNTDERIIAGVASGIAAYFGIDPLIIRLLFIALLFANGLGLLIYVVLWIAVPAAETSLQKLEMQGKEPNLTEFQELTKDKPVEANRQSTLYRIVNAPLRLIGFIFDGLRRFFGVFGSVIRVVAGAAFLVFAFIFATLGTMALVVFGTNVNSRYIVSDLPLAELAQNPLYFVGLGSIYLLGLIPLIFFAILGMSLIRRKNQFHTAATATLIGIWILAAGGAAAAGSQIGPWVYTHMQAAEEKSAVTRTLSVAEFDRIVVSDNVEITVRQGATPSVTFSGTEEGLARLQATTTNGVLELSQSSKQKKDDFRLCFACAERRVSGVITLPTLTTLTSSDNANVRVEGFSTDLNLQVQRNSDLTIQGLGRTATSTNQRITLLVEDNASAWLTGNVAALMATVRDNARLNAADLDAARVDISAEDNTYSQVSPTQFFAATTTQNSFVRSSNSVVSSTVVERQNSRVYFEVR